jgi:hypothetical protein
VKPDGLSAKLRWKSYSFCHVDSLLGTPFCPISGCQRKRVNSSQVFATLTCEDDAQMWPVTFTTEPNEAHLAGFVNALNRLTVSVDEAYRKTFRKE